MVETPKEFRYILLGLKLRIFTNNRNLICEFLNTDIILRWRIILNEYGPDIEYVKGDKNIVVDTLSRLPLNGNQDTTQKSTYQEENVSEINGIEEQPEGNFPINLKLIQKYQRSETIIIYKYKDGTHHKGSFNGGSNIDLDLITCEDKIVIDSIIQSCVLHWYHTYFHHLNG